MKKSKPTASTKTFQSKAQNTPLPAADPASEIYDISYAILENLDAIVFVADMETHKILYANAYAKNLLGDITGKPCWQTFNEDAEDPCPFCTTKYLIDNEDEPHGALNYDSFNTVTRGWYDVSERPLELPDGRSVRIHYATDITDRKDAYTRLGKNEEKYRTVADYTYDWECWMNEQKLFEYVSPSCQRITGYGVDAFFADPSLLKRIIHPEDRTRFKRHQEKTFKSSRYSHLEFRIIAKDGTTRWISHYCQPVYNEKGEFRGRRSSNRDITEKKLAEHRMELNELRLSTLLNLYEKKELDTDSICNFVLESTLPITNSTLGFMGFLNENESVVTIHAWSKTVMKECAIHQKPIDFMVDKAGIWSEAIRQKRTYIVNDYSLDSLLKKGTPEGHIAITRFMTVPLMSDDRVIAIVAVGNKEEPYTDDDADQISLLLEGMWQILQRKEAEDQVLKQSEKIRHFASAIAHDLKSPAISVHGFARMLKEKYTKHLDDRAVKYCEQIMKSSEQISTLAEDINTFISTRDTPPDFEVLELQEIWDTIREEFMLQLQERNISWSEQDIKIVRIVGNRTGILRVLRNLVDNALKYGGEDLSEITMGYESSENHHILLVENNGEGIPQEFVEDIFLEFKRQTQNPQVYGTGLGLAIVKEIAKKHKGRSWLVTGPRGNPVFCVSISQDLEV